MSKSSSANIQPSVSASSPATATTLTSKNQLYALASRVPLIKSPSLSLPKPVKLPPDLHPLPADISAYFVYPFSLESYVLDANTPSSATVDQLLAKHKQYLENREREKQDRQRDILRKVAPGWHGAVLLPTTSSRPEPAASRVLDSKAETNQQQSEQRQLQHERTPLDDLADHLAQLDALNSAGAPSHAQNEYVHQ